MKKQLTCCRNTLQPVKLVNLDIELAMESAVSTQRHETKIRKVHLGYL
jgi:hypothetical protein